MYDAHVRNGHIEAACALKRERCRAAHDLATFASTVGLLPPVGERVSAGSVRYATRSSCEKAGSSPSSLTLYFGTLAPC